MPDSDGSSWATQHSTLNATMNDNEVEHLSIQSFGFKPPLAPPSTNSPVSPAPALLHPPTSTSILASPDHPVENPRTDSTPLSPMHVANEIKPEKSLSKVQIAGAAARERMAQIQGRYKRQLPSTAEEIIGYGIKASYGGYVRDTGVTQMKRKLREIDRKLTPMKKREENTGHLIEKKKGYHEVCKHLEWPMWRCQNAIHKLEMERDSAVVHYGRKGCLKLTSRVAALPRELRDMIYHNLLDEKLLDVIRHQVEYEIAPHRKFSDWSSCWPYRLAEYPYHESYHFLIDQYVQPEIIPEIYECAADMISKKHHGFEIRLSEFAAFSSARSLYFGLPISAFFHTLALEMSVYEVMGGMQDESYDLADLDWVAFKLHVRKLLLDVSKSIEEKGGVLIIRTHTYSGWRNGFSEIVQYRGIVEDVVEELKKKNFKKVKMIWDQLFGFSTRNDLAHVCPW